MKSIVYEVSYYGKQAHAAAHPGTGAARLMRCSLRFTLPT